MLWQRVRCLVVAVTATAGAAGTVWWLVPTLLAAAAGPDAAVVRLCTGLVLLGLGWGWLGVLAGVVEAWRRAPGAPGSPGAIVTARGLWRWVLAACGVALSTTVAAPWAHAEAPDAGPHPSATQRQAAVVVRPAMVTVGPGDCLWSIAAGEMQPGAGPATVGARVRAIYRANRGVIGADPDLIRPGQRLRLPR